MRWILRSKIEKAIVSEASIDAVEGFTIDEDLIERVGFWPGEKVLVVDKKTGAQVDADLMVAERGSGRIAIHGALAHNINAGDEITILGFELTDHPMVAKSILVDDNNHFERFL